MANSLTVTIHIDERDPSKNSVSYSDPSKQVMVGDEVDFRVEGTTGLVEVRFPNGSPFSDSSFTLGGPTLAAQSAPKTVSMSASVADYGFIAFPTSSTPRNPKPDQPGTTSGDIEVVPERGGGWEKPGKGPGRR
ncbi:hypothetical protein [Archangium sp.]|uniref:hypothetical protein n=1 Tax=Archangium sp. TaxID=1872627 RepID=UPI00286AB480|nr:hypothetical protein [Archangium sp.]